MYQLIQFKTTLRSILLFTALTCFGLSPALQAVTPPPDGGYAGFNTAEGSDALFNLTTGQNNTALGYQALFHNTTGTNNTGIGFRSLFFNNGNQNTAAGINALGINTTGNFNTSFGVNSLAKNTTGSQHTALGVQALFNNTTGASNVAFGFQSLFANTTGDANVALGFRALTANTTGIRHVAIGFEALASNTTGSNASNAVGYQALHDNTTGNFNNAFGWEALSNCTTGSNNVAMGDGAQDSLTTGSANTAIGANSGIVTTGSGNISIGSGIGGTTTLSNVIEIGLDGDNTAGNRCFIGSIRGVTVGQGNGVAVIIDSDGQLGTVNSSRRFKNDIKPLDKISSESILALKPVKYHYKGMDDKKAAETPQYGLIAEDVAEVNPDLVVLDKDGQPLTVRYDAVNVMLLNEFLKEHKKVQELEKGMAALAATLKEQASQIQKVSAQVELNTRTPRTVANK